MLQFLTSLPDACAELTINNGHVEYIFSNENINIPAAETIATYNCSPGYQLVEGSSLRACDLNGTWNGSDPSCQGEL